MRAVCLVLLVGCGSVKNATIDAPVVDAAPDVAIDAGCQTKHLLVGGTDVTAQGWAVEMQTPAAVTNGPDYVHLATSTTTGAATSGALLLNYPGAFDATKPVKLEVVMLVEQVNTHNQFDSAAAILGLFSGGFGMPQDRSQMIYVDNGAIGWADDTQSFNVTIVNNEFHTFVLSVDASGAATVTVDGVAALTRGGFIVNGSIGIGDQTNDPNVDSMLRIRSVNLLCP